MLNRKGYKGYIQLAQRSGQYKHLNAIAVYEDEFKGFNPLTEEIKYEPNFRDRDAGEQPVGYVGYFQLVNGFEKTVYWTRKQIDDHRKQFSKMSGKDKPTGVWASNFDAMALKTVLRNLLSKWGPMTVDMQTAVVSDEESPEPVDVTDSVEDTEEAKATQLAASFASDPEPVTEPKEVQEVGGKDNAEQQEIFEQPAY
nr:recombinase RecT [Lactobacillus selangorensis]